MKTASDFIWQLIHSMSSSEKLFFKRNFTAAPGRPHRLYLRLFNAIAAQKKYNEPALLKKFHPVLHKRNMAYQKHYLQRQVCDALVQYDSRNNLAHEIYNYISLIRIYRKKGLLREAHITWKKAVDKARTTESFGLLNILKTEFEKMILSSNAQTHYDELHAIFKANLITYHEYRELITLRDIYTEILLLKKKAHFDLDESIRMTIEQLNRQVESCQPPVQSRSFWYRHYYFMSKATSLYLLQQPAAAMRVLQEVWKEWKGNSEYMGTHTEFYLELLYMINYAGILQGEYDIVRQVFRDDLNKQIREPGHLAQFEAIQFLALNKIYNKTARYDEVEKLLSQVKIKYQQWERVLNSDINRTVCLSLAIACFVLEQYPDALYYTKRGINYFKDGAREEHAAFAQILLLLIAYSMNHARLFDAQYRTTYAYFHRRKKKHPFESALVQCLQRSFYMKDRKVKIREYEKALQVFEQNKNDVVQQMAVSIFNYPGWLASRVRDIPYRQYVEKMSGSATDAFREAL